MHPVVHTVRKSTKCPNNLNKTRGEKNYIFFRRLGFGTWTLLTDGVDGDSGVCEIPSDGLVRVKFQM